MKKLNFEEMEVLNAGRYEKQGCMGCGRAVIAGAMIGSWFGGGVGALVGAITVGLGPNCLDIFGSERC